MTRTDLASYVQDHVPGMTKKHAAEVVDAVFDAMKDTLGRGENLKISSFGNFLLHDKKPRLGRNPQTGEAMTICARRVVTFKPSQVLKGLLNP